MGLSLTLVYMKILKLLSADHLPGVVCDDPCRQQACALKSYPEIYLVFLEVCFHENTTQGISKTPVNKLKRFCSFF